VKNKYLYILFLGFLISCNNTEIEDTNFNSTDDNYYLIDVSVEVDSDDYVLAPSKISYDSAIANGLEASIFVFYPRKVIQNFKDSVELYQIGDTVVLPASLIIPMNKNEKAIFGDYVLTWWQSGTGMQRAIVLNKDSSLTPTVYYLDNQYSFYSNITNISFWIDTLKPNSYIVLKDEIMPGKSIFVEKDYFSVFYTIINISEENILALSWAGLLEVIEKDKFSTIDLHQDFNAGDSVLVPYFGTFSKGVVKSVWNDIGKMTVEIFFIDEEIEIYVNMIDTKFISVAD